MLFDLFQAIQLLYETFFTIMYTFRMYTLEITACNTSNA